MLGTVECEGAEGGHAARDIPLIPVLISTQYTHGMTDSQTEGKGVMSMF